MSFQLTEQSVKHPLTLTNYQLLVCGDVCVGKFEQQDKGWLWQSYLNFHQGTVADKEAAIAQIKLALEKTLAS